MVAAQHGLTAAQIERVASAFEHDDLAQTPGQTSAQAKTEADPHASEKAYIKSFIQRYFVRLR